MKIADRCLNPQAEAIEEAQTEIRLIVRDGWLANKPKSVINERVQKAIRAALKQIDIADLRSAAYRSLNAFAERQYSTYLRAFGVNSIFLLSLIVLGDSEANTSKFEHAERDIAQSAPVSFDTQAKGIPLQIYSKDYFERYVVPVFDSAPNTAKFEHAARDVRQHALMSFNTQAKGVPLQIYSKDYFDKYVVPVFDRIAEQKALDPDDISGSNSLRNRAEMEVRYAAHLRSIERLKSSGVRLVVCSVHADCSERCSGWQGRVYSLDGTSGVTADSRRFVPLETATDVYYTTKAGKTYKNGLLGFNCRHELYPYRDGMVIPHVDKQTQEKQRAIDRRQRELERRVRDYKERALIFKNIDRERYVKSKRLASVWQKEYIRFSKDNGRAYYPSRIKLL